MEDMRHNGSPPFGYKRVDGRLEPGDNHWVLKLIGEMRDTAFSMAQIAEHLNRAGVQGPRGGKWTRQYISRVLKATPQSEN